MIIPVANKCLQCNRIFCCPKCRIKHESIAHVPPTIATHHHQTTNNKCNNKASNLIASAVVSAQCALCAGRPFVLQACHSAEQLHHLAEKHLPLHCNKCTRIFTTVADFQSAQLLQCDLLRLPAVVVPPPPPPPTDKYGRVLLDLMPGGSSINTNIIRCAGGGCGGGESNTANSSLKSIASTATYVNQPHGGLTQPLAYANEDGVGLARAGSAPVDEPPSDVPAVKSTPVLLTPISQWNLRWKTKLMGGSVDTSDGGPSVSLSATGGSIGGGYTDSISSIRNVSSVLNNTSSSQLMLSHTSVHSPQEAHYQPPHHQQQHQQPPPPPQQPYRKQQHPQHGSHKVGGGGHRNPMVRQTSTPMHRGGGGGNTVAGGVASHHQYYGGNHSGQAAAPDGRPRSHSFDSMGHMSSIGPHNISSESNMSPPVCSSSTSAPSNQAPKSAQRPRHKLPPSATPLRQVMSRSIQKALVQHGVMSKFMATHHGHYSPAALGGGSFTGVVPASPASMPLDLRTSPVIRRMHSTADNSSDSSGGSSAGSSSRASSASPPLPVSAFQRRRRLGSDASLLGSTIAETPEADVDAHSHVHHLQLQHLLPSLTAGRQASDDNNADSVYESCKSYDAANDHEEQATEGSGNDSPDAPVAAATAACTETDNTPIRKILGLAIRANSFAERQAAPRPSCYEPSTAEDEAVAVADVGTKAATTTEHPIGTVLVDSDRNNINTTLATTPVKQSAGKKAAVEEDDDDDGPDVWYTPPVKLHKVSSCPVWFRIPYGGNDTHIHRKPPAPAEDTSALAHRSSDSGEENLFSSTKHSNISGSNTSGAAALGRLRSARSELSAFYMREKFLARPSPVRSAKKRRTANGSNSGTPTFKKPKKPSKNNDGAGIWSRVTSGLKRLASFGTQQPVVPLTPPLSPPDAGLLKKCTTLGVEEVTEVVQTVVMRTMSSSATLGGGMTGSQETAIVTLTHGKRRRTLTNSASGLSPTGVEKSTALAISRISGRPPLKRMRRIGWGVGGESLV